MLEARPGAIDVWLVDEQQVDDDALLAQYRRLLSDDEQARYRRLNPDQQRHQYLVARALVRCVLSGYLGESDPAALAFTSSPHGKPALAQGNGLQFNLSHTGGLIALAVARDVPVGIDVEQCARHAEIVKLARRYFSEAETAALLALPDAAQHARFYDLWTLKEAYLKACGTGLRTPLHAFSFRFEHGSIDIRFGTELADDPAAWRFWQLDAGKGFRLSLAVNDPSWQEYTLTVHEGIPLQKFAEGNPAVVRKSFRGIR